MTARRLYHWLRGIALVFAAAIFFIAAPAQRARLGPNDYVFLLGALVIAIVLSNVRPPGSAAEVRGKPGTVHVDRNVFLMPLLSVVFVQYGWYEVAAISTLGYLAGPTSSRRATLLSHILDSTVRVPWWYAIAPLHDYLLVASTPLGFAPLALFVGLNAAWYVFGVFFWLDIFAALRTGRSIFPFWRAHLSDPGWVAVLISALIWGYVVFQVALREGAALGLAVLAPSVLTAVLVVQLARTRSRVHRLTLSREAVEAMLGANDPLPQMRSILESIDPRLTRESVEIFGFGRGGTEAWSSVARLGPTPPATLPRSAARALYDLRAHGGTVEGVRGAEGIVIAYAAFDAEKHLLGALVVYRGEGAPAIVSAREFERAATELAPLLSDYGTITATRTAASIDLLTGLVNRRTVSRAAEEAIVYTRSGGTYAMLLIDVDHFKTINDLLGHNAGDRALRRIGAIMRENVRDADVAGRFGGEEFIVLMRDADRERALSIAERLRSAIETSGLAYADGAPITISVGVTYARASDVSSEMLIERADKALYRAKNTGRNRVVESPLVAV